MAERSRKHSRGVSNDNPALILIPDLQFPHASYVHTHTHMNIHIPTPHPGVKADKLVIFHCVV